MVSVGEVAPGDARRVEKSAPGAIHRGVIQELTRRQVLTAQEQQDRALERTESVGKKIREAELQKVPQMWVVGDEEAGTDTVAPRVRHAEDDGVRLPIDEAIAQLVKLDADRTR